VVMLTLHFAEWMLLQTMPRSRELPCRRDINETEEYQAFKYSKRRRTLSIPDDTIRE